LYNSKDWNRSRNRSYKLIDIEIVIEDPEVLFNGTVLII